MIRNNKIVALLLGALLLFALFPAAPAWAAAPAAPDAPPPQDASAVPPVSLAINSVPIYTDVPPVIVSGRTLVPARAVFEALGGTVAWNDSEPPGRVSVSCADIQVTLTIGSVTALVNEAEAEMDVPPQIVSDRTLIPVRFVSESLHFTVRWDEANRTVNIYTPDFDMPPDITGIEELDVTATGTGTRVTAVGSKLFENVTSGSLDPRQVYLDVPDSLLIATTTALEWQREISVVRGVRAEEPAESVTRLIFELSEEAAPLLTFSPEENSLYLDFPAPQVPYNPWADGKLSVILDPGHGVDTLGKRSPDETLIEYLFNRDMAARVKAQLERHGVEVLYTVYDEMDLPLADRCLAANQSGADLLVSLHANAGNGKSWSNSNGWEIYTYKKGSHSERLANLIHDEAIPASGLADRGVKAERYYIIRNVNMPAVLIEHAFYTNTNEVELLKSPEFRERLAVMDAKGILKFLGVPWVAQ